MTKINKGQTQFESSIDQLQSFVNTQAGNSGKFLTTNGTTMGWAEAGGATPTLTTFTGYSGTTLDTGLTLANVNMVFKNGMLLEIGAGNDYTVSGSVITFTTPLVSADKVSVVVGAQATDIVNIYNAKSLYEKITTLTPAGATVTCTLQDGSDTYQVTPTQNFTFNIDESGITIPSSTATSFFVIFDMTNGAFDITWDSRIQWGNTSPTMTAEVQYLFNFWSPDGGTTWVGNQCYSYQI